MNVTADDSTVSVYILHDRADQPQDGVTYTDAADARRVAQANGWAVVEYVFEFSDTNLIWTPDGGNRWPPGT